MTKPNKKGMYEIKDIENLGLPLFKEFECINFEDEEFRVDYWTVSEFKQLLKITLTEEEKSLNNIKAFRTANGYYGWSALYSMSEILSARGHNVKYYRS